ncbi:SRPBCC family protein [Gammaproteobacteria bacterium]|jgi:hypothetical protein|nr:SRPBCC family protein [Gammaproteobacteria bacterium]
MKILKEEVLFNCSAEALWEILSDVSRSDWVPSIESISLDDNLRSFDMEGIGSVTEKILLNDDENMTLQYSAIKTPSKIDHHLATMKISSAGQNQSTLLWTTEIDPEIFADGVHHGMLISIEGIKKVIES